VRQRQHTCGEPAPHEQRAQVQVKALLLEQAGAGAMARGEAAFCAAAPLPRPGAPARARAARPPPRMSAAQASRRAVLRWALLTAASSAAGVAAGVAPAAHAYGAYEEPLKKPAKAKAKKPEFMREGGIAFADLAVGTGPSPQSGDFVIVDFVAYLSNGVAFDNTKQPGRKSLVFQIGKNKGLLVCLQDR
jgi:hypothetical protein